MYPPLTKVKLKNLTQPVWESEYLEPEKRWYRGIMKMA